MINDYIITLDVDWASDDIINYVAQKLQSESVKATWFITHDSPAIRRLFEYPSLFEIGLHPNFMPGSTHGATVEEVMNYLLEVAPNAKSFRTHGLFQYSSLLNRLREEYNMLYDSSLFLVNSPYIVPHLMYYSSSPLIRLPYFWADYTEMNTPKKNFSIENPKYQVPGMKIFNFHPVHIALNSSSLDSYFRLKVSYRADEWNLDAVIKHRNSDTIGTENMFSSLIHLNRKKGGGKTMSEVGEEWLNFYDTN